MALVAFGNSLLGSMVLICFRITLARYLGFNDPIECVIEVEFGGKKMRSMAIKSGLCGFLEQLSTINATLQF